MTILVTGGSGYIGSHISVELLNKGEELIIVDNFSNSNERALENIKKITNKDFKFYNVDINDEVKLQKVFDENKIDAVIDLAAYKAVGESVKNPLSYYKNNVSSVITLLLVMKKYNVKTIVFSSTATVYGDPETLPLTENSPVGNTASPYATSKYMVERILKDLYVSDNEWNIAVLRYFNPIGAHESGIIGEIPNGIPANLMPFITKVAKGKLEELNIFGDDYDTEDGTAIRDYVHVVDLARGHINALEKLNKDGSGMHTYNLGSGKGYSVMDIVNTFEKANNVKLPYKITNRRPGDVACYFASIKKAQDELGYIPTKTLEDMCKDSWNFEKNYD